MSCAHLQLGTPLRGERGASENQSNLLSVTENNNSSKPLWTLAEYRLHIANSSSDPGAPASHAGVVLNVSLSCASTSHSGPNGQCLLHVSQVSAPSLSVPCWNWPPCSHAWMTPPTPHWSRTPLPTSLLLSVQGHFGPKPWCVGTHDSCSSFNIQIMNSLLCARWPTRPTGKNGEQE